PDSPATCSHNRRSSGTVSSYKNCETTQIYFPLFFSVHSVSSVPSVVIPFAPAPRKKIVIEGTSVSSAPLRRIALLHRRARRVPHSRLHLAVMPDYLTMRSRPRLQGATMLLALTGWMDGGLV